MRAPVVLLVLIGLAAPAVLADLAKKKDKHHHHVSSTSTSTSTTTTTETPTPANVRNAESFDFTVITGDIPFIGEVDIIKIHLPLPAPPRNDSTASSNGTDSTDSTDSTDTDSTDTDGGLIVRPGADGHGRPPRYPEPPVTEAPEKPEVPQIPQIPQIPEIPKIPEIPEVPEIPEEPEKPQVPEKPEVPEEPQEPEIEKPESPRLPETPDSTDAPNSPESPESPPDPAADDPTVIIPDIATFDAVFANRSRLRDHIRVFAFGGVYEVIVNRTSNSVDVVMIRALPQNTTQKEEEGNVVDSADSAKDPAGDLKPPTVAAPAGRVLMAMRGPSVAFRSYSGAGQDDNGTGELGERDRGNGKRDDDGDEDGNDDGDENEDASDGDAEGKKTKVGGQDDEKGDTSAGGDGNPASDDSNPPLPDGRTPAVFINGSSVIGVKLGVVTFNTSGFFKLNVSMAGDFMTVILSQLGDVKGLKKVDLKNIMVTPPERKLKGTGEAQNLLGSARYSGDGAQIAKADPGSSSSSGSGGGGPSAATTLLALMAVGAAVTLGAAFLVTRARARAQVASFVHNGADDYYGAVETGEEAVYFSRGFHE